MLIISGSYPPQICGVGDYTEKLCTTSSAKNWTLYTSRKWGLSTLFRHIKAINKIPEKTLNMQYPTQGYGWSLAPHLLCLYYSWFTRKRFSVTIHEQSQLSTKARWAQKIILLTANRIIFTNEYERNYAISYVPCVRKRSTVIKIYSNITASARINPIEERTIDVVNFGHIRPFKGLEQFIHDISHITIPVKTVIAGQIPQGFEDYFETIKVTAKKANIEIRLNLCDADVSALLNDTKVAYLPFPDGASERRGSLLASFANGAVVATSIGKFTTPQLEQAIIEIKNTNIQSIINDTTLLEQKQQFELEFMKTEMPQSWEDIAQQYNTFLL